MGYVKILLLILGEFYGESNHQTHMIFRNMGMPRMKAIARATTWWFKQLQWCARQLFTWDNNHPSSWLCYMKICTEKKQISSVPLVRCAEEVVGVLKKSIGSMVQLDPIGAFLQRNPWKSTRWSVDRPEISAMDWPRLVCESYLRIHSLRFITSHLSNSKNMHLVT